VRQGRNRRQSAAGAGLDFPDASRQTVRKENTMSRHPYARAAAVLTALLLLAGLTLSPLAPAAHAQGAETDATIRFVHVLAGGGPVDIYVDGEARVEGIAYGTATEYAAIPPGDHTVQVTNAGDELANAFIEEDLTAGEGEAYNVIVGGRPDDFQAAIFEVDLDAVDPGMVRYRFIQSTPDAGDLLIQLDVSAGEGIEPDADGVPGIDAGDPLPGGAFMGEEDYREIEAGTYDIVAYLDETDEVRLEAADIQMDEGFVYDLVVVGSEDSERLDILPLITQVSRPCSELLGAGQAGDGCIRFVHASPDAGQVDLYLDGSLVVEGISYGTATEFAAISAVEHQIQVVPAGGETDAAVLDETLGVDAGQAYQGVVAGILTDDDDDDNDLRLVTSEIDLTPIPAGQARIRALHTVPDAGDVNIVASGVELFSEVGFSDVSDYAVVDAAAYDVQVVATENNTPVVEAAGLQLQEGTVYDVFAIGRAADNTVELLVLESNATVREGAQGTPTAIEPGTDTTPATVGEEEATVVGGGAPDVTPSPIEDAPVTPIVTPEATETP
jgi:hypothetical protein